MSEVGKKRKIRSGHRAYTTKLLNEAKEFQTIDGELSTDIKDKLRQLERSLKERLSILSGLDEELLNAAEDEEAIMEEIETSGQFRDGVHAALVKIEEKLKSSPASYSPPTVQTSKSPAKETVSTKLPKLVLRKFAGEPKDWIPFWDQFKNAVHENSNLSEVDKFNYLKSLLEGNAATTIQALALTAANYESAVQLLNQRFGNKQVIISSHMDALLRLPAVGSHDVKGLRKTYDKIEAHVKGLQALDVPTSTYGSLLVPVLMSKIPEDIRLLLGREVKDGEWDLDKILDLLREEVENRERCGGIQALSLNETRRQGPSMNASHRSNTTTAAALIVNERKVSCSYCRGNHTSAKCPVVTNVKARKDILRKEGRCFVCLKRGHLSRSCDAKYSCSRCSSKHHISICDKQHGNPGMSNIEAGNAPYSSNTLSSFPRASFNQITHTFNPKSGFPEANNSAPLAQAFVPYPPHGFNAMHTPNFPQHVAPTSNQMPSSSLYVSAKDSARLQTSQSCVPYPSYSSNTAQTIPQHVAPTENPTTTSSLHVSAKDSILLQTAEAYIGTERIRIIFDSGSQKSYVTQRIQSKLGLPLLCKESLLINTFGSADKGKATVCDSVELTVADVKGETSTPIKAFVVPTICAPLGKQEIRKARQEYDYLRNLEVADSNSGASEVHIDLLIGADYMWKFFTGRMRRGSNNEGPVASETILGWVLSGPVPSSHSSKLSSVNFVSTHVLRVATEGHDKISVDKDLSQLWDFESIGIRDKETVHQSFVKNISLENGRYCVTLPRKETHETLPDNYDLSLARLNNQVKRLRKEPKILREYNRTFQEQINLGMIEKVDHPGRLGETHYLPHQAVIRKDAMTTKLRVVFDASAKAKASLPCLNDTMHTGPPMTPEIFQILARFRCHRIGLAVDIEKAFLNIAIQKDQRDLTRFLWIDDVDAVDPNIVIYRFCRVIFGMNCSPFLLNATLNYHVKQYYAANPALAEKMLSGLYVDDWTGGGQCEEEALNMYREAKTCFASGMFNLRKWVSNDKTLISRIKQDRVNHDEEPNASPTVTTDNETYAKSTLGHLDEIDAAKEHKVLGLNWNLEDDKICLKVGAVAEFADKLEPTKRNVLKIAAKMFDPLGIISPVMVNFRFLLQALCVAKYDWDSPIATGEQRQLKKWLKSLESVGTFAVNRHYLSNISREAEVKRVSLHGFGDASKKGYCAVVYLCTETTEGYQTSLVASKSRVAPIAPITIPRMELVAALILSRLMATVKRALSTLLNIEECRYWTDSQTVLHWITSNKEYKQFVQNRVDEIHSLTNTSDWGHCPGVENPADLGSRGCLATELLECKVWWKGPPWLRKAADNYPKVDCPSEEELPEECMRERRLRQKIDSQEDNQSTCLVNTQDRSRGMLPTNMSEEFKPERYSSFFRLLRVTATVWRFIRLLQSKVKKETVAPKSGAIFSAKELTEAEERWIREAQRNPKNHKNLSHQLGLFKDGSDILRCRGRLTNAPLKEETKFPILLPKEHHITKLIVEDVHHRLMHGGVKETLAALREKYWIPRGRGFIKRILHKCVTCKKMEGKAFYPPSSADLPENRVSDLAAFTHVGVDFAGPLYVKKDGKNTEDSMQKVYICLFVCASSRALHLELCPSLSADAFNRCLRRFIARRGVPKSITSDNAKTFKHAAKEISKLFKSKEVRDFTEQRRIDWKFILEKAPWWGGFYERMVQLVKRRLRKILGNAKVTYEELSTLLAEIEGILNSRPITYVYAKVDEEPLTPAHLLIGRRLTTLPAEPAMSDAEDEERDAECLTRRARYVNKLLQHFWQRWRREYLVDLREYHNLKRRGQTTMRDVKVGDIVIIQEDGLPRAQWRTGEVKELLPSRDGETRGVALRVLNKKGSRVITLRRPVQQLYPLEVTSDRQSEQRGESTQNSNKNRSTDQAPARRDRPPRRAAAQNADLIRRLVDQTD